MDFGMDLLESPPVAWPVVSLSQLFLSTQLAFISPPCFCLSILPTNKGLEKQLGELLHIPAGKVNKALLNESLIWCLLIKIHTHKRENKSDANMVN